MAEFMLISVLCGSLIDAGPNRSSIWLSQLIVVSDLCDGVILSQRIVWVVSLSTIQVLSYSS